jgi:NADPH:quinone reductase-like Zn-dependent oxidoreductase
LALSSDCYAKSGKTLFENCIARMHHVACRQANVNTTFIEVINMSHSQPTMRRAVAHGGAGIDAITIETSEIPEPGAGEVLVRIHVATLNYRDLIGVKGLIPGMAGDNYVPLSCSAGEVVAIGAGVTRVAVRDRVAPVFDQGWVSGDQTSRKPNSLGARIDGVARDYAVFSEVGL